MSPPICAACKHFIRQHHDTWGCTAYVYTPDSPRVVAQSSPPLYGGACGCNSLDQLEHIRFQVAELTFWETFTLDA